MNVLLEYIIFDCGIGIPKVRMASSGSQRNVCNRPAILIGVVLILIFVCAVLLKISSERAKEGAELESLLADSRQTIDRLLREQDLTKLAKEESETELNKLKSSKSGMYHSQYLLAPLHIYIYTAILNDKNKLTEDLNKQRTEVESCKTGLCAFSFCLPWLLVKLAVHL